MNPNDSSSRRFRPSNGRFTMTAYPGTNIILNVTSLSGQYYGVHWHLFKPGRYYSNVFQYGGLNVTVGPVNEEHEGTYVTCKHYCSGIETCTIQLIVYDCPAGRWGPPSCLGVCDPCYNGGICHDLSGSCICPPGFIGNNCLQACGEHRLGPECDIPCGVDQGLNVSCAGSQLCRPGPYGCNCFSGYTGIYCNESCESGQYGVDCLQDCHCVGGSACDIYSGECPGDCQDGWSGPSCQVPDMCPDGFYGKHCLKKCHCLEYTSCDRETGSCDLSAGQCAFGYMTSPSMSTVCDAYSGCFDSCSKTCHCSRGAADCNSVTGECFSGVCLSGWTGQTCQIESPKLVEPPTLFHKDCDKIAIIWNAWNRDRDSGEGPIGGYDIYFKSETSDWSKAAFVTQDSTTINVLSYILIGLESDVEYTLSVAPVHAHDVNAGPMYVYSGQELVTRTLQSPARMFNRSGASVPWALFGITFVLLVVCGGILLGLWVYRRMTLTSTSPDNAPSAQVPSGTKTSSETTAPSPNDCLYDYPTFSAEGSTPMRTYQGLNEGPKIPESKIPQSGDQDEYAEIQCNPSAPVYETNVVTVL